MSLFLQIKIGFIAFSYSLPSEDNIKKKQKNLLRILKSKFMDIFNLTINMVTLKCLTQLNNKFREISNLLFYTILFLYIMMKNAFTITYGTFWN